MFEVDKEIMVTQTAVIKEVTAQHLESEYTCLAWNDFGNTSVTIRLKKRNKGAFIFYLFFHRVHFKRTVVNLDCERDANKSMTVSQHRVQFLVSDKKAIWRKCVMCLCYITATWPSLIPCPVVLLLLAAGLGMAAHVKRLELQLIFRSYCQSGKCNTGQKTFRCFALPVCYTHTLGLTL